MKKLYVGVPRGTRRHRESAPGPPAAKGTHHARCARHAPDPSSPFSLRATVSGWPWASAIHSARAAARRCSAVMATLGWAFRRPTRCSVPASITSTAITAGSEAASSPSFSVDGIYVIGPCCKQRTSGSLVATSAAFASRSIPARVGMGDWTTMVTEPVSSCSCLGFGSAYSSLVRRAKSLTPACRPRLSPSTRRSRTAKSDGRITIFAVSPAPPDGAGVSGV